MSLQDFNFYQNSETHLMSWQARCNRLSTFSFRDFGWLEPLCTGQFFHSTAFKFWNVLGANFSWTQPSILLIWTNGLVLSKLVARTSQVHVDLSPVFKNSINNSVPCLFKPTSAEELLGMLEFGNNNRTQHPTDANAQSSRSHAVFQVII